MMQRIVVNMITNMVVIKKRLENKIIATSNFFSLDPLDDIVPFDNVIPQIISQQSNQF